MEKYNSSEIESKWQEKWAKNPDLYSAEDDSSQEKKYILDMFPYPSGDGLHAGHAESYTATDIVSRYLRMKGFNVLHPQGFDAFGLPAENYAIKTKIHPSITTKKAIANFTRQMKMMGFSYDWDREINTSNLNYYKWTQWFFLLLYKNGLAYKKKGKVNWCESCQTVLANEQAENGICERCKNPVIQKDLDQWFFKITDFIEDKILKEVRPLSTQTTERGRTSKTSGLINGLQNVDWPESTKSAQVNWIGKSEGTIIKFKVQPCLPAGRSSKFKVELEVFTTRVDTIFGCTYCVIAPEHPIIQELKSQITDYSEVEKYVQDSKKKTDLDRMETKIKTGVEIKGIKVVNPFNKKEIPLFVADYVLGHYGTGAVMAVPAHDERDFEFAKKHDLEIKKVIEPCFCQKRDPGKIKEGEPFVERNAISALVKHWEKDEYIALNWRQVDWRTLITGGIENGQTAEEAARMEVLEETGYKNLKLIKELPMMHSKFYHVPKKENRFAHFHSFYFQLENGEREKVSDIEKAIHDVVWVPKKKMDQYFTAESHNYIWKILEESEGAYCDDGVLTNSEKYSRLSSVEAREKMTEWLEKNKLGEKKINYKLRDWLVSRQRYWGAPIPIIYCHKCSENSKNQITNSKQIPNSNNQNSKFEITEIDGEKYAVIPVPEEQLPVELPDDVDFKPTGESPLKYSKKFQDVLCPKCGGKARRESDTMDTFVCSSWYYFRYADSKNDQEFASKENLKKWLPVDLYVGGAEHSVLHLLYARFFTKVLHNLGYIDFDEPFLKLRHQGIILAEDGRKMSKSLGNVINPDVVVKEFGADALRMFEMFMGPLEDAKPWNTRGIVGIVRFIEKINKAISNFQFPISNEISNDKNKKSDSLMHKTIKKIGEDIESLRFNTAISSLMILVNELDKQKILEIRNWELVILLLSPFAPHISEELWNKLGHSESIFKEKWPEYNPELIKDEEFELIVQVSGKVRDKIKTKMDIAEDEAKKLAMQSEKVKNNISGKEIKKVIFVKNRLINIVV